MSDQYSDFKGWNAVPFGYCKKHQAAYYEKEVVRSLKHSSGCEQASLKLLEIGFGNGGFMGWARSRGHAVFGVEVETSRLAVAAKAGFAVAESVDALVSANDLSSLDGVIAFDVFEHLTHQQLVDLLRKVRALLRPGGWVLARFPNGDSPFGRINQHGDITHMTALGSMAAHQLAVATSFRLESVGSEAIPVLKIGMARGLVNLSRLALLPLLELPLQMLLNTYLPGRLKWYPLAPNLVCRLSKAE